MKFHFAEPRFPYTRWRMVSENEVWEVILHQYMYGCRVRAGYADDVGCEVDYCAGSDSQWQFMLFNTVRLIMEQHSEDELTYAEMKKLFPEQRIKPMENEPKLWAYLVNLAGSDLTDFLLNDAKDFMAQVAQVPSWTPEDMLREAGLLDDDVDSRRIDQAHGS